MPELLFVELRGGSYAIENPTDIHIRAVEEFARTPISDRRREKELAHAISSMIPALPEYLASCIEYELPNGTSRIDTKFNLQVHELLDIIQVAAVSYCQSLIERLKEAKPKDKAEDAQIRNKIVMLEKKLAEDLSKQQNSILLVMGGEEIPSALPDEMLPTPRPKPVGMGKPNGKKETTIEAKVSRQESQAE